MGQHRKRIMTAAHMATLKEMTADDEDSDDSEVRATARAASVLALQHGIRFVSLRIA